MPTTNHRLGFAPAKVNLALHVIGQRSDGYHLLDSLVAFAGVGDLVSAVPADELSLQVTGPRAAGVPTDASNLVIRAARFIGVTGAKITLDKHLPAAAGIGGGSSDAAAALRVLSEMTGQKIPSDTAGLGADVPVCLHPSICRMEGVGEQISAIGGWPALPAVLVNPGVDVPTPAVFKALTQKTNDPLPCSLPVPSDFSDAVQFLQTTRNDLLHPAQSAEPVIVDVISALTHAGASFAQMSGSGATCFGLFDSLAKAQAAADQLNQTGWWVAPTVLR